MERRGGSILVTLLSAVLGIASPDNCRQEREVERINMAPVVYVDNSVCRVSDSDRNLRKIQFYSTDKLIYEEKLENGKQKRVYEYDVQEILRKAGIREEGEHYLTVFAQDDKDEGVCVMRTITMPPQPEVVTVKTNP